MCIYLVGPCLGAWTDDRRPGKLKSSSSSSRTTTQQCWAKLRLSWTELTATIWNHLSKQVDETATEVWDEIDQSAILPDDNTPAQLKVIDMQHKTKTLLFLRKWKKSSSSWLVTTTTANLKIDDHLVTTLSSEEGTVSHLHSNSTANHRICWLIGAGKVFES